MFIPNKDSLDNPVKNYSKTTASHVELTCRVDYKSDLDKVKEIALQSHSSEFQGVLEKEAAFHHAEFGHGAIMFTVWFWIDATTDLQVIEARSRAIVMLQKAFSPGRYRACISDYACGDVS